MDIRDYFIDGAAILLTNAPEQLRPTHSFRALKPPSFQHTQSPSIPGYLDLPGTWHKANASNFDL
jgi:hypothetical protein